MKTEIKLGDKVRDKITGFTGIAVARTEFFNGCIQYNVMPKGNANKMPEDMSIDQQSLEVISQKKKKIKKENTGGANHLGFQQRGY